jgi:hypothetical protein
MAAKPDVVRDSAARLRNADILAAMTADWLPWSTTTAAVFIALWFFVLIPAVSWHEVARSLAHPACAPPLAFSVLATVGTL